MNYLPVILLAALFGEPNPKPAPKRNHMLRAFNSFQLVSLFAGLPYLIAWLNSNPFPWSAAGFYTAIVAYIVLFIVLCVAVFDWAGD